MNKVSILLLNYNWKNFNEKCIISILNQTYTNLEIIFIDNNSSDWSLEEVEEIFSKEIKSWIIKIVKNSENLRFAWWNNSWIPFVSKESKYIWLLNNDTVIDENCLQELIKWIESDDQLWAVSSLILDKWQEDQIINMTERWMVRIMNLFWWQIWDNYKIKNDIYYTNFLCGCSFLYKKSLVDKPFFDFYKWYSEDLQLSWELLMKWYKLWVCKKSIVNHFWWGTSNKVPYLRRFLNFRNYFINYYAFLNKQTRRKLSILFFVYTTLSLFFNISNTQILKAKIKAFIRIKKNPQYIDEVRERVYSQKVLSDNEFLSQISYKLIWYSQKEWWLRTSIMKIINGSIRFYYQIFWLKYRK